MGRDKSSSPCGAVYFTEKSDANFQWNWSKVTCVACLKFNEPQEKPPIVFKSHTVEEIERPESFNTIKYQVNPRRIRKENFPVVDTLEEAIEQALTSNYSKEIINKLYFQDKEFESGIFPVLYITVAHMTVFKEREAIELPNYTHMLITVSGMTACSLNANEVQTTTDHIEITCPTCIGKIA